MNTQTHQYPASPSSNYSAPPAVQPFFRPAQGRMLGGVCAAIADRFGWDRTIVRLGAVATFLLPGPNVLAYLVAWAVIPSEYKYWTQQANAQHWQPGESA